MEVIFWQAGLEGFEQGGVAPTLTWSGTKITKAGVVELQKALPKCKIYSNPTK